MLSSPTTILKCSLALWLARHARGSLFMTAPVASTTCYGGKPCVLSWIDDETSSPALSTYDLTNVALYTGTPTQQTEVYKITTLDPRTTDAITVIIPAPVAANGTEFFIRMDPARPRGGNLTTYQSFSARFTLLGMTGVTPSNGVRLLATAGSTFDGNFTGTHSGNMSSDSTSSQLPSSETPSTMQQSRLVAATRAKTTTSSTSGANSNLHGLTMSYILTISQIGGIMLAFESLKYCVL